MDDVRDGVREVVDEAERILWRLGSVARRDQGDIDVIEVLIVLRDVSESVSFTRDMSFCKSNKVRGE